MDATTFVGNAPSEIEPSVSDIWNLLTTSVTVIVPVYHGEKFITRCLDSLSSQTYKDFKVIIVLDDMEHDHTYDVIVSHELYECGHILLLASSEKSSPANARNRALSYVTSPLICFLDVDDAWEPDKLRLQVAYHRNSTCSVTFTSGWWHRDTGTMLLRTVDEATLRRHFNACLFMWSSVMFSSTALMYVRRTTGRYFDTEWPQCDDGELLVRMHKVGFKFGVVPEPLTHLYEHGGNLTQGNLWAANWWAARTWFRYGYYLNGMRHILFGIVAVLSDKLGIRRQLRTLRMKLNGAQEVT